MCRSGTPVETAAKSVARNAGWESCGGSKQRQLLLFTRPKFLWQQSLKGGDQPAFDPPENTTKQVLTTTPPEQSLRGDAIPEGALGARPEGCPLDANEAD